MRIVNLLMMILTFFVGVSVFMTNQGDTARVMGGLLATLVCFYPFYATWRLLGEKHAASVKGAIAANVTGVVFFALICLVAFAMGTGMAGPS